MTTIVITMAIDDDKLKDERQESIYDITDGLQEVLDDHYGEYINSFEVTEL